MSDKRTLDLARQWSTDIDAHPEILPQETTAAAEVIRDLPDEYVDAKKLREVIDKWADREITSDAHLLFREVEALLPAPPAPLTLADMRPEDRAECQWMQADLKGNRIIIGAIADGGVNYIKQDGKTYWGNMGSVAGEIVPLPDLPRMKWPGNEPEETHFDDLPDEVKQVMKDSIEDYKAGRFMDIDIPETATTRPEDVPEGEVWQVETPFTGGVGYRHAGQANPWFVTYPGHSERTWHVWNDSEVTLIARLVPETTEQDAEQEFDPAYTYRDKDGDEWECIEGRWLTDDTHAERVAAREDGHGRASLPERFGPYTRIEEPTMTKRTTDDWEALLDGITPGPWGWEWDQGILSITGASGEAVAIDADIRDSDVLAAAPEAVAEVVRLRRELEQLRDMYDALATGNCAVANQHRNSRDAITRILEGGSNDH